MSTGVSLRVALAQCDAAADHVALVAEAASAGADIVVFPEMLSNGYPTYAAGDAAGEAAWRASATDCDGAFVQGFRDAAVRHRIHVVTTLLERARAPSNTALLIAPDGTTPLTHRKVHTCFFNPPEEACGRGTSAGVANIDTGAGPVTVGLMICMDREYADVAAALSAAGAELALVPNCCDLAVDPAVGDVRTAQARGRAFETVMGLAVANYPRPKADGHSFAVGPTGALLAVAGEAPALLTADFDLAAIRAARRGDWFRWRDTMLVAAQ